jgi:hypothetical protein
MADQHMPNDASRKDKAEGERWDETVNRSDGDATPRRYDQPVEEDENPVMPAEDSTTQTTKI